MNHREESFAYVISSAALGNDIIGLMLSVVRDGKVIHREEKRCGDDASARMVVRRFIGEWQQKLFSEEGDFGRPRLVGAHRGH